MRLAVVLTHEGYLGIDGGAYLLQAKRILGLSLDAVSFTRVPLGPGIILVPFITALGDDVGYKVWSAFFGILPLLPAVYLLARRGLSPWISVAAVAFVTVDLWQWEMLVTGALPLVGIGLILLAMWGLSGTGTRWENVAITCAIGLIPYINQTSAGLAAVAIPTFLAGLCLSERSLDPLRRNFHPLATGVVAGLFALPWYSDVLPGSPRMSFPGPKVYLNPWNSAGWVQVWFAIPFAVAAIVAARSPIVKAIGLVVAAHSTLTLFSSYDESIINIFFRSQHLVSPLLIILIAWAAVSLVPRMSRIGVQAMAAGVFLVMAVGSGWLFQEQTYYSDMVTPSMDRARAQIPDNASTTLVTNGFLMALWLSALEGTPTAWTFSTQPPVRFQAQYAQTQCLLGWRECDPLAAADELNAEYVLVDTRFPHVNQREPNLYGAPEDTWAPTEAAPWLDIIYSEGTVRLWRVAQGGT